MSTSRPSQSGVSLSAVTQAGVPDSAVLPKTLPAKVMADRLEPKKGPRPVLILGGGIHGVAIARELVLNGISVIIADTGDLASGATSKSSRLIHGGLRYLEYGDLPLVRESLAERRRNLDLAGNFVEPLRLFIPVTNSWKGFVSAAAGFLGGKRAGWSQWLSGTSQDRGFWPVRLGLSMYDWIAQDASLPPSARVALDAPQAPRLHPGKYQGLMAYTDAQMRFPERVVLAVLADAVEIARQRGLQCDVHTYAHLTAGAEGWQLSSARQTTPLSIDPALCINVSGAAGDAAIQGLGITALPLFGGTKGSHLLTWHAGLREALRGQAVYAEAPDGRPVFTLPFGEGVLIGTTDVPYTGDPAAATASEAEIAYLVEMVTAVFGITLMSEDIVATYCGVRPLPRMHTTTQAAISRDHALVWHHAGERPVVTLVGGKLTTWRSVAEEVANHVLGKLNCLRTNDTRKRPVPGGSPTFASTEKRDQWLRECAVATESTVAEARALWDLFGLRTREILEQVQSQPRIPVADTPLTTRIICWIIEQEHVTQLDDLVERRLMTVFQSRLSRQHLEDLAQCLVACGRLPADQVAAQVTATQARLTQHYHRRWDAISTV